MKEGERNEGERGITINMLTKKFGLFGSREYLTSEVQERPDL